MKSFMTICIVMLIAILGSLYLITSSNSPSTGPAAETEATQESQTPAQAPLPDLGILNKRF